MHRPSCHPTRCAVLRFSVPGRRLVEVVDNNFPLIEPESELLAKRIEKPGSIISPSVSKARDRSLPVPIRARVPTGQRANSVIGNSGTSSVPCDAL